MAVFKAYDIRGKCPEQINETLAKKVGRAFADFLGNSGAVAVGHDMRQTSPGLAAALAEGLHDGGVDTREVGQVTSPTLYYAVGSQSLAGGVMVTASHNPAGDNGFKLCREGVRPVGSQSGLIEIEASCAGDYPAPLEARGTAEQVDLVEAYLDHVLKISDGTIGPLKVAIDCGNGVAGPTVERFLARLPQVETVKLYFEPDGSFPNHPANPIISANLVDLCAVVKEHGCDLGVALDGDGDRCVFVDERGDRVLSDLTTALFAGHVLKDDPGAHVVYDAVSSTVVKEEVEAAGGVPVMERVGHAFIKATMRKTDAAFAGENSGHYYWRDHWYADSALIAIARLLSIRTSQDAPLSEIMAPLRRTAMSGERNYSVEDKDAALVALQETFPGGEVSHLDGVTIRMDGWWFNARKSNTEPLLRLNVEAKNAQDLAEGLRRLETILGTPSSH
ncbi:MAG: phosphomannomutase/phosphoglucomutase [Planctomycetes bacterium]|nr:phosphomannomutase/phosphoglucomutase [Planctomycetota bacterium]